MGFRLYTLLIVAASVLTPSHERGLNRQVRDSHMPPAGVPTFQRDSVEKLPQWDDIFDRSSNYRVLAEYGSHALPLRTAVESVPDVITNSRRLPLRDAVEKRPPPDEAADFDIELDDIDVNKNTLAFKTQKQPKPEQVPTKQPLPQPQQPQFQPQGYIIGQTLYLQPNLFYPQPQTFYSPSDYFRSLITTSFIPLEPYRIDNPYQQLFRLPKQMRSLYPSNPFLKQLEQKRAEKQFQDKNGEEGKNLFCYIEGLAVYRKDPLSFHPEYLDPNTCTHIIYAFATIDPHTLTIMPNDEEYDVVQGGYRSVTGLKRINPNLKVLISLGGKREEGSHRFSAMVSSAAKRRDFIRSVITFLKQYDFDGLDVHWQYPGAEELGGRTTDKEQFALLLEELSETFKPRGWLLTVSAPSSRFRIEDGFNPQRLANTVDFVNVQAYDFHSDREPVADHHANLYPRPDDSDLNVFYNVDYAVRYWLKKGFPSSKMILGIPFFGRSFTLQNYNETDVGATIKGPGKEGFYTQTPGFLAYFEICDLVLNEGWQRFTDESGAPYIVNGDQWVGFDDDQSIEQKMMYVKEMGLGGAFVWALDLDDYKGLCGEKWPLMSAAKKYLKQTETAAAVVEEYPTKPFGMCQSDGLYSDPKDCSAYFICRNGLIYHLSCGAHMMFDPTSGKCGYIDGNRCRPGQVIFIPNALKELDRLIAAAKKLEETPKVVCYITNWAFYRKSDGKFVPEHLDQRLCTHVVYAFSSLDPEKLLLKEFDPWADLDNNLYERVTSLADTIPMLALGGWTDSAGDKYSRLVSDGSARRKFVIGVVSFLRRHGFKGLHLDWNYPVCWQSNCKKGPASDKPNFTKLVQELRKEFDKQNPPLVLAVAISGYKEVIDVAYELPALGDAVDFMSVMTYDYHGSWERKTGHVSPLYSKSDDKYPQYNTNFTMEYLASMGAPRSKLLVGIPFYGQSFTISMSGSFGQGVPAAGPGEAGEYTKQPGMLAYYEICHRIRNQRWVVTRENSGANGPYAHARDQWVGYDDPASVKQKAKYIKSSGFGGAVAWTVDLDDFSNKCCQGSFPLLRSLNRELGRISDDVSEGDCRKPPEPVTPAPPTLTTGVDTGASSTESMWSKPTTTRRSTTTSPWWTTSSSRRTTTTERSTTSPWWTQPTTTSRKTTTTRRTTTTTTTRRTTTTPWWQTEGTTIPPPGVVMPEVEKPDGSMKCEPGTYRADPNSCNSYYRCILGELRKQYCAGGLHWNKERQICDWPNEAKCAEKKPTKKPSTTPPSWDWTTTRRTTRRPTTTTRRPTTGSLEEKCRNGQYYPHEDCTKFYVCVNGKLITQECAPGLSWNMEHSLCDWVHRVKCLGRKELAQEAQKLMNEAGHQPHTSCQAGTFSAFAGDCSRYLHCLWGKYEEFQCASGLHWNSEKQTCDWPDNARCSEEGGAIPVPPNDIDEEAPKPPPVIPTTKPTTSTMTYPEWQPATTTKKPTTTPEPLDLKPNSGYFKIVCYFTNWAWYRRGIGKYLPEDIDSDLCTHIVYGFAVLDYENLIVKAHDSWADFDNKFYERVTAYKKKGLKVSLALGGWNDSQGDKYSRLVNNPAARQRFINHVLGFLEKYDFDGLDLDWEYPKCWQVDCKKGPDSDKQAFAAFVTELKQAFRPKGYLLSAAVSPSKTVIDAGYDVPVLAKNLDWVAVMTYDFHGQWDKQTGHVAPLYLYPDDEVVFFNANFSINYWISEGVPRRKIVMGMPLYGQSFQLEKESVNGLNAKAPGPGQAGEFTRAAGFLAYYEICDRILNKGWKVVQDPKRRMGPYAYKGNQWVSFDDREMIRMKSEYIRKMDLGGGMIWALDLDDFRNRCGQGRHPLLSTIRNVLAEPGNAYFDEPSTKRPTPVIPPVRPEVSSSVPLIETSSMRPEIQHSTSQPIVDPNSEYKVVCYFTNWAWYRQGVGKYLPSDIDPDLCTHIVYGFAVLNGEQLIIKPHDSWADFDNKFYEKVTEYKNKGIKVLIAIGGWNDSAGDKYSRLVNNPSSRRRFIGHVVDFIQSNNFDGLDLDWEYPKCWQVDCNKGPSSDKPAFADFVEELHEAFKPKGLLLSAAVSPNKRVIDAGYDVPTLSRYLDWIAVMCYDYHGQWDKVTGHVAPMYAHPEDVDVSFNANFSINYWIEQGADRKKIVMGMPMYGQSFSLADNKQNGLNAATYGGGEAGEETRARGFLAYYEICTNIKKKGWKVVRDRKGRIGPYAYLRDQWVSFDDIAMIKHKSEYIKAMGLGGGMIWALDLDDFRNICDCENYPLLRTINRVLRGYAKPAPTCTLGEPMDKPVKKPDFVSTTDLVVVEPDLILPQEVLPCQGRLFVADKDNCNQYYMCNEGQLQLKVCPFGLFWNMDHCDLPEDTQCYLDATTASSEVEPPKLSHPGTDYFPDQSGYKIVCYFTNWAWYRQGDGKYTPEDIDPTLCTHITYGFAELDPNSLTIRPHDSWADIDNDFYKKVTSLRSKGIKVSIALGGWNDSLSNKYSRLVNDPQARSRFITHVSQFIEKWGFDGLDLDWKYPKCWQFDCNKGPSSDKPAFAAFVEELHKAFKPKGLLLSAAVSPNKNVIDAGYDVPTLSRYLDWIAVMCYDYHEQWDKVTGHANSSINYWIEQGADRKKIVMGMPMYGQLFSVDYRLQNGSNSATYGGREAGVETGARGFLAYYEICTNIKKKGWKVVRDRKGRIGPYAYFQNHMVTFDDIAMIKRKSEYIKAMGLGGGMIWALDLDDFRNICDCENYPLLRTINRVLRGYTKPAPTCTLGEPMKPEPIPTTDILVLEPDLVLLQDVLPCQGRLFVADKDHCNQYYLCNQGQLQLQVCPSGLFWNKDHCDWPENTRCHPDATTTSPEIEPPITDEMPAIVTTSKPSHPGTDYFPDRSGYKIVCYFTNWAWYRQGDGKYTPEDIDPTLCTHITYGFAVLDPNSLTIRPHDSWADIDNDFYKKVTSLRSKGIKVSIALGGWNDSLGNKYSRLVNDPQARARFVTHVSQFIEKWGFDGLDLDWEYPKCWQVDCNKGPDSDKEGFASLVAELSAAFKPKGWLLSSAVSPSKAVIDVGYDVPSLSRHFDWIAVMTYDFHGHWDKQTGHVAPLYYYPGDNYDYFNANFSLNYWLEKGAPAKKIVMGFPLYGQSFTLADTKNRGLNAKSYGPGEAGEFTRAGGFLAFYEICDRVKRRGWTVTRDPKGRIGPYAYMGNQWVSYDDIAEVRRKTKLVKELGLGGGMIWALDLDDFRNRCGCGKHPLLKMLNHELRGTRRDNDLQNCT